MDSDFFCNLWPNKKEHFYRDKVIEPFAQSGLTCVCATLGSLTGKGPEYFLDLQREGKLNTQDPVSWSETLKPFGMKLAYLPFDTRKLRFYMDELVSLDDLFLLSYYSGMSLDILRDPDENGWVCESHVVILHRDRIIDPQRGESYYALDHWCKGFHTKRLFRVLPLKHPRGL
ncbi:MAG: hypothetical protein ACOZFS_13465 [Thermodesulfobacteriota bacterium]